MKTNHSLRQIIERDKIFKNQINPENPQAKISVRPGEHLERMAVIALKRVCVQLGISYWK